MQRVVAVLNPTSGRLSAEDKHRLLREVWPSGLTVQQTDPDDDPTEWLRAVRAEEPDLILAAGGDGTVRHIVSSLHVAGMRVPVAHVPFGTANVVAASLGFSVTPAAALREIRAGSNFESQDPPEAHFGLGATSTVDTLSVTWPDGMRTVLDDVAADQLLVLDVVFRDGFESGDLLRWDEGR